MRFFSSAPVSTGADSFLAAGRFGRFREFIPNSGRCRADTLPNMQPGEALLAWFDRHKRALPWRREDSPPGASSFPVVDPYGVWISEIMLQQTRVETARPYYLRFLARFPDVASLAEADEAEVLALWSGLGYYRRCRALLAAARTIVAEGGALPRTARELELLPGIGPYTAAAIASIAFAEVVPVLDGNVERVVCRYAARSAGAKRRSDRSALLAIAAGFLDPARPGDSNQALMELGATVCTPRSPRCTVCPLAEGCQARALAAAESFPASEPRPAAERVRQLVAFVEVRGRVLLFRRSPSAGQLAGLWDFPAVDLGGPAAPEAQLAAAFGGFWTLGAEVTRLRHAITTRSFAIEVRRAVYAPAGEGAGVESDTLAEGAGAEPGVVGGSARASDGAATADLHWWGREAAGGLPLTGVARKVLARAASQPT